MGYRNGDGNRKVEGRVSKSIEKMVVGKRQKKKSEKELEEKKKLITWAERPVDEFREWGKGTKELKHICQGPPRDPDYTNNKNESGRKRKNE